MLHMAYCPHCGRVYIGNYIGNVLKCCGICGYEPCVETELTARDWTMMETEQKKEWEAECQQRARQSPVFEEEAYQRMLMVLEECEKEAAKPVYIPKCPTCGSPNISKIGVFDRLTSLGLMGVYDPNLRKTFRCKNCGYTW